MTISSTTIVSQGIHRIPTDTFTLICVTLRGKENASRPSQCDFKTIIATASVCKAWRDNPILIAERQSASLSLPRQICSRKICGELLFRTCLRGPGTRVLYQLRGEDIPWRDSSVADYAFQRIGQIVKGVTDAKNFNSILNHPKVTNEIINKWDALVSSLNARPWWQAGVLP